MLNIILSLTSLDNICCYCVNQDKALNPLSALLGLYPNEIAQLVKLPDHLASHPYLIEYYGTVEWSVKVCSLNVINFF